MKNIILIILTILLLSPLYAGDTDKSETGYIASIMPGIYYGQSYIYDNEAQEANEGGLINLSFSGTLEKSQFSADLGTSIMYGSSINFKLHDHVILSLGLLQQSILLFINRSNTGIFFGIDKGSFRNKARTGLPLGASIGYESNFGNRNFPFRMKLGIQLQNVRNVLYDTYVTFSSGYAF